MTTQARLDRHTEWVGVMQARGIAARTGHRISFWQFTRYGIVVTILSTVIAWLSVWLRYFM